MSNESHQGPLIIVVTEGHWLTQFLWKRASRTTACGKKLSPDRHRGEEGKEKGQDKSSTGSSNCSLEMVGHFHSRFIDQVKPC